MKVEFARSSDEPQVKQLLAECELPYEDLTPSHLQHFLVLRDGTQVAGVIGLELLTKFALLRSLAVQAQFRRQGIASLLTKQAEEYARSCEVEAIYMLTTTAEDFFAKRGYYRVNRDTVPAVVQETAEFRSLCSSAAVCMYKCLNTVENFDSKK